MPTPPRATRRGALVGSLGTALGTVVLAGCDTDDLRPHDDARPTLTPSVSPGRRTPDQTLVDEVTVAVSGAAAVVRRARTLPDLRAPLGPLQRAHRTHLTALTTGAGPTAGPTATPTATPSAAPSGSATSVPLTSTATALTAVRTTEQALQQQLVSAAGRAQSGVLAALLASMSASVAQHLATLPSQLGS